MGLFKLLNLLVNLFGKKKEKGPTIEECRLNDEIRKEEKRRQQESRPTTREQDEKITRCKRIENEECDKDKVQNPYEKCQRMLRNERKRQKILKEKEEREERERKRKEEAKEYMRLTYGEEGPWSIKRRSKIVENHRRSQKITENQRRSKIVENHRSLQKRIDTEGRVTQKECEREQRIVVSVSIEEDAIRIKHRIAVLY